MDRQLLLLSLIVISLHVVPRSLVAIALIVMI